MMQDTCCARLLCTQQELRAQASQYAIGLHLGVMRFSLLLFLHMLEMGKHEALEMQGWLQCHLCFRHLPKCMQIWGAEMQGWL